MQNFNHNTYIMTYKMTVNADDNHNNHIFLQHSASKY